MSWLNPVWLPHQLWGGGPASQSPKPYFLTDRLLACVYGGRRWLVGGRQAAPRLCPERQAAPAALMCVPACPPAEEDRESWNKSYRQSFLSDRWVLGGLRRGSRRRCLLPRATACVRRPCSTANASPPLPCPAPTRSYKLYLQQVAQELRAIRNGPGGVQFCNLSPAWYARGAAPAALGRARPRRRCGPRLAQVAARPIYVQPHLRPPETQPTLACMHPPHPPHPSIHAPTLPTGATWSRTSCSTSPPLSCRWRFGRNPAVGGRPADGCIYGGCI